LAALVAWWTRWSRSASAPRRARRRLTAQHSRARAWSAAQWSADLL